MNQEQIIRRGIESIDHRLLIQRGIALAVLAAIVWIAIAVVNHVFKKIRDKKESLHLRFLQRLITAFILIGAVILGFSVFGGIASVWKTLLGGTAIMSAVLAFAAQDVIKDILAGWMISIYKPFEIGNRIELEDGTAGVVRDITMRHIVLKTMDTQVLVIPNSKLNAMSLRNNSYQTDTRSMQLSFFISYNSDVEKAMQVIRDAIIASEHTIPGKEVDGEMQYAPIYFMAYMDSSLQLATTVYYHPTVATEVVKSDINLRVNHALAEHGIEIPYNYINVVQRQEG